MVVKACAVCFGKDIFVWIQAIQVLGRLAGTRLSNHVQSIVDICRRRAVHGLGQTRSVCGQDVAGGNRRAADGDKAILVVVGIGQRHSIEGFGQKVSIRVVAVGDHPAAAGLTQQLIPRVVIVGRGDAVLDASGAVAVRVIVVVGAREDGYVVGGPALFVN